MKPAVLILGATGVVGRGIVQAAVEAVRPVIAVARDRAHLEQLRALHPGADLTVVTGSVAGDADGAQLAQALRALDRPLAGVVVAVSGGSGRGRLLDQPIEALQRRLDEDLLPHLAAARHLLPLLAAANRGGSYVLIGGPGSELPWAGYGARSVAAAAQRMLACVLHDEARALGVRVQLLTVDAPVCSDHNRARACPQWPSAVDLGRRALELVDCSGSGEPTRAVVRYAASGNSRSGVDADVDCGRANSSHGYPTRKTLAAIPPHPAVPTAQEADSAPSLLTARCLQDARTLLETLPPLNPNQEGSLP